MTTITIKELHAHTGEWVRKASENGEITVTDRGRPVALIKPIAFSPSPVTPDASGNPQGSTNPFLTRRLLPGFHELQTRLTGGTDSTDIISEMREGR